MCGRGSKEGIELQVDHIKPKELGGRAGIENGQALCAQSTALMTGTVLLGMGSGEKKDHEKK